GLLVCRRLRIAPSTWYAIRTGASRGRIRLHTALKGSKMGGPVRVLIVDDSAYMRKVVREMLSRSRGLEVVGAARDGQEALELVEKLRPDVVTLDLNMPRLDGIDFLRRQMALLPLPVVLLSSASESG